MKFLACVFLSIFCLFTEAQSGIPASLTQLIEMYTKSVGIYPNPHTIQAAEKGHERTQLALAGIYFRTHVDSNNRTQVSEEIEQSYYWFKKAAEQGNAKAQAILGAINCCAHSWNFRAKKNFFLIGKKPLIRENWEKAITWYKKAAAQGNLEARFWLNNLHLAGLKIERDIGEEVIFATAQDLKGDMDAKLELALTTLVSSHKFSRKEMQVAVGFIEDLAEQGHSRSQQWLGILHITQGFSPTIGLILKEYPQYQRELMPIDYKQAVHWLREAAKQDNLAALMMVGQLHDESRIINIKTGKEVEELKEMLLR